RQNSIVKTIIDTIPQSIILKDPDSRYITCNAAFSRMVNRDPEEIVGLNDTDLYPAEFAEKYRADDKSVINKRETHEFIERFVKNGEEIWIETIKTPVFGPEGQSEGIIVVFRDITQRKKDEDRLQESEQRYRELSEELETRVKERTKELDQTKRDSDLFFDVTLEYLCLTDFSGRFLKLSPSWAKNLGWREEELMNRSFLYFIHREDRLSTINLVRELIAGGRILDKGNRFKRADGSWVWLSWSAVGLPERGIVLAAAHDITARVETEERMRVARETAEAANQAKSQFISTMSHELRTPLNAVLGYALLLAPLVQDERAERYIKSIDSSGRALLAIINDLLDLTKVESGRLELTPAPFEPRKMLDEVSEIFRFGAEEKGLYIEFRSSSALPKTLLLDAARLRQILINLLGNSIKFTDKGSVRVLLDAVVPPDAKNNTPNAMYLVTLRISVEDTGIGMTEQYRLHLFEPFSQQDSTIARKYGGTGLGLAIAKRLLDLMSGSISCESEMNKGTRFIIDIPNVRAAGNAAEVVSFIGGNRKTSEVEKARNPESIRGRVLLVAQDDETIETVTNILAAPTTEVIVARDYQTAVERAKDADVILIDFEPKIFLMLQEDPVAAARPTVLITEKKHRDDAMLGFRAGAVDFLTKPIDGEELRARIRVHIDMKRIRDTLERKNLEITEGKRAIEEKNNELEALVARLDRLSMTDELTGLANRRAVSARLAEEVARAKRAQRPITVLMGDLDRFKLINDRLGHAAGDAVLAESARRFEQALRESDCLGRWGGEEFLAVLPETDSVDALRAAERARERIGDTPIAYDTELVRATISIGAAYMVPKSSDNPEACASALIRAADDALYRAKAKGRNRVEGSAAVIPNVPPNPPTEES
ncbi:MAG: diguanylate cyclase, partial [Treponemataceae bacterium]